MRLIDADALEQELFDADWILDNDEHMVEDILRKQPTIDAVEVVRCRDCYYWKPDGVFGKATIGRPFAYGYCSLGGYMSEFGFCSNGHPKTDK